MEKKCTQYEALFTFRSEDELLEHIKNCDDCRLEHEKMLKVSELIQEAKPYYKQQQRKLTKLKAACAIFIVMFSGTSLGILNLNTQFSDTIKYGTELSAEELGLPVDNYGLIYLE